jgi:hypothetical protein
LPIINVILMFSWSNKNIWYSALIV